MGQGLSTRIQAKKVQEHHEAVNFFHKNNGKLQKSQFTYKNKNGTGVFGQVTTLKIIGSKHLLAAKSNLPNKLNADVSREANLLLRLDHPSVVKAFGFDEKSQILFMELAIGCLDRSMVERYGDRELVIHHGMALCDALSYLKEVKIAHCDLKPANLLVFVDGTIKLADFGSAIDLRKFPSGKCGSYVMTTATVKYYAPELYDSSRTYTFEPDIYAVGAIILEMLDLSKPVQFWIKKQRNDSPPLIVKGKGYSCDFLNLLCDSLALEKDTRISCEGLKVILENWIKKIKAQKKVKNLERMGPDPKKRVLKRKRNYTPSP